MCERKRLYRERRRAGRCLTLVTAVGVSTARAQRSKIRGRTLALEQPEPYSRATHRLHAHPTVSAYGRRVSPCCCRIGTLVHVVAACGSCVCKLPIGTCTTAHISCVIREATGRTLGALPILGVGVRTDSVQARAADCPRVTAHAVAPSITVTVAAGPVGAGGARG